jgi:hypothetical protein
MSRFRKPFFKKSHDCWYVQIEGRQIRLSKDRDEAFLLYHKMMINWYRFRRQSVVPFGRKLTLVLQQASCPWGRGIMPLGTEAALAAMPSRYDDDPASRYSSIAMRPK